MNKPKHGHSVLFAAYRDWALDVYKQITRHPCVGHIELVSSLVDLENTIRTRNVERVRDQSVRYVMNDFDIVMLCGWSWQVSKDLLSRVVVVSEHPASDDKYSVGTPIQNQIIDGVRWTKHRVVKIGYPELGERLYSPAHETDMSLEGNMDDILSEMRSTAAHVYTKFLFDWPDVKWEQWPENEYKAVPRTPDCSELKRDTFVHSNTRQLYDSIRMCESPYPNAFIEDDAGVLTFERVSWRKK